MARHHVPVLFASLLLLAGAGSSRACPPGAPPTLRAEADDCDFIVVGTLQNAQHSAAGDSTDFVITQVLKPHPALIGRRVIQMPRYLPNDDPTKPQQIVAFGTVEKGNLELYRGVPGRQALADYVKRLLTIERDDRVRTLGYCFDFLQHEESEIAGDAYKEFASSSDRDYQRVGRTLQSARLRLWIQDEKTPPHRLGMYAMLLAHAGDPNDAALLRKAIERTAKESPGSLHELLTGYTILKPKEGWAFTLDLLKSPSREFYVRYAGLKAARYLWANYPESVAHKDILAGMSSLLAQDDIADLAIEFLRERQCWQMTESILPLFKKPGDEAKLIRRNVVRYALHCPDVRAKRLINDLRQTDPDVVSQAEESLPEEAKVIQLDVK